MKLKTLTLTALASFFLYGAAPAAKSAADVHSTASPGGVDVFKPDWENIAANYRCPEWFRDAKFGIFVHWGVYSVPGFSNEWYSRQMYKKGTTEFKHHRQKYGPHDKFGYKDFIPRFKAEKFNAEKWMSLFKEAGAKYVVPVAEHHDGFAMYDSAHNPWNAVKMGPKKDIIRLLKNAAEKEGIVFGLSSHRLENSWFFAPGMTFPSDVQDKSIGLYGFRLPNISEHDKKITYPDYVTDDFLRHTRELIDKYQPQLIWFDWTVNQIRPQFNEFLAYYYNSSLEWKKGVVVNTKQGYPNNVQVSDIERGRSSVMLKYPWQTDTSVGKKSWGFVLGERNKTAVQIIHDLIDIVSKNGNLLLNIGPKPDGSITDKQADVLRGIGKWLKTNGEAIYGTRPWIKFGEGETKGKFGTFSDGAATSYKKGDVRFTTKGNDLYVISLSWGDNLLIRSLDKKTVADAKLLNVSLLGSGEKIKWNLADEGLSITFPEKQTGSDAFVFKLSFDKKVGAHLEPEWKDVPFKQGSY
jgi:alpha-L-fucosidase